MNFFKKNGRLKHHLTIFVIVLFFCSVSVLGLNNPSVRTITADYTAMNAFFLPVKSSDSYHCDGNSLLRNSFFGQTFHEPEENILILPNNSHSLNNNNTDRTNDSPSPAVPENNITDYGNYVPGGNLYPIISCDLSTENILTLNNTTKERPDTSKLLLSGYDFGYDKDSDEPLALIIHTHATECYSRENSSYYEEGSTTRSYDEELNMIAVGKVLADTMNENGIRTLHCTVMHDAQSYSNSYSYAASSIKDYIKNYPSIKYVFDIHRDAVMYESGAKARALTTVDGQEAAQIMLLAGTDAGGADFPDWQKNLTFALKLADKISGKYPSLMRPIALRGASYNEQYTNGSLLIEIGTDGNTLSQAKYSAQLLGKAIAQLIIG